MNPMTAFVAIMLGAALTLAPRPALADDISGAIPLTLVITDNSQLVGHVTCTVTGAPCILFGASNIKLRLNGFIISGLADPNRGCGRSGNVPDEDGIDTGGMSHVEIEGPGLVRRFRNHGIDMSGGTQNKVDRVTVSTNCNVGIHVMSDDSDVEDSTAVRNSSINNAPCGGIEVGGNGNRIRRNETSGNGLFFPFQDFGVGVFGDNNLFEENSVVGNTTHGIHFFAGATGNLVRRNVALGNNPIEVSNTSAPFIVDIADANPAGTNTYEENLCERSIGGAAAACPSLPQFAGHHNIR